VNLEGAGLRKVPSSFAPIARAEPIFVSFPSTVARRGTSRPRVERFLALFEQIGEQSEEVEPPVKLGLHVPFDQSSSQRFLGVDFETDAHAAIVAMNTELKHPCRPGVLCACAFPARPRSARTKDQSLSWYLLSRE